MATVKLNFCPPSVRDKEGTLYYRVIHNRLVRQISSGYKVYIWEWDEKHHAIVTTLSPERTDKLMALQEKIRMDMDRFNRIISSYISRGVSFTAETIVQEYISLIPRLSLFNYMEGIIQRLIHIGKIRTSETYRSALNSFSRFNNNEDIMLDTFTPALMEAYEAYLQAGGLVANTTSFYLRILRAVYNRACLQGLIMPGVKPFSRVYTGIGKTAKRAVGIDVIRDIRDLDLESNSTADYARDLFLLSFYLRGMSFIDMAYLKKSDLTNGVVCYRRRKTGQQLYVRWTGEMQAILDKYAENKTDFLMPVITSDLYDYRNQYRNKHYKVNLGLKTVAQRLGLKIPLTTYVARHSWASIARSKGISLSIISEGLGHDSELTTRIYLATLDTAAVDRANDLILSSI